MPAKAQQILQEVGKWLSVNGESIYGTTSGGPSIQAWLLSDKEKKPLKVDRHSQGLMIHLPENPVDNIDNVIVLKYKGNYVPFHNG